MLALRLVLTALADIFRGFPQTLRIVLVPALLFWAGQAGVFHLVMSRAMPPQVLMVTFVALALICGTWAGVNYHRRVLLGESFGWWPTVHIREMLGYGLILVPMGLVVLAVTVGAQFGLLRAAMPLLTAPSGGDVHLHMASVIRVTVGIALVAGILSTTLGLRWFSQLPAIAIGEPMTNIFRGHRGGWPVLLLAAVIVVIADFLLGRLAAAVMPSPAEVMQVAIQATVMPPVAADMLVAALGGSTMLTILIGLSAMTQVFQAVFGIGLLTAIHGHYSGRRVLR